MSAQIGYWRSTKEDVFVNVYEIVHDFERYNQISQMFTSLPTLPKAKAHPIIPSTDIAFNAAGLHCWLHFKLSDTCIPRSQQCVKCSMPLCLFPVSYCILYQNYDWSTYHISLHSIKLKKPLLRILLWSFRILCDDIFIIFWSNNMPRHIISEQLDFTFDQLGNVIYI